MKKVIILFLSIMFSVVLSGCEEVDYDNLIYVTIYPVEYITESIVGEHYTIRRVYPAGSDIHHFEPITRDIVEISDSKFLFYIGSGLETFVAQMEGSSFENENVTLIELTHGMQLYDWGEEEEIDGEDHHDEDGHFHEYDPHVWLDPLRMIEMGQVILDQVIADKPELETEFRANFEAFQLQMNDVHNKFLDMVANADTKTIIVDHDAYVYWTSLYGIDRVRIQQGNEGTDASIQIIDEISNIANSLGIKYVLVTQSEGDSDVANRIIEEIEGTKLILHNISILSIDEMENEETYYTLMLDNIETLRMALNK